MSEVVIQVDPNNRDDSGYQRLVLADMNESQQRLMARSTCRKCFLIVAFLLYEAYCMGMLILFLGTSRPEWIVCAIAISAGMAVGMDGGIGLSLGLKVSETYAHFWTCTMTILYAIFYLIAQLHELDRLGLKIAASFVHVLLAIHFNTL